jgi:hypothetical protein
VAGVLREEQQIFDVSRTEYFCALADHTRMRSNKYFVHCTARDRKFNRKTIARSFQQRSFPAVADVTCARLSTSHRTYRYGYCKHHIRHDDD